MAVSSTVVDYEGPKSQPSSFEMKKPAPVPKGVEIITMATTGKVNPELTMIPAVPSLWTVAAKSFPDYYRRMVSARTESPPYSLLAESGVDLFNIAKDRLLYQSPYWTGGKVINEPYACYDNHECSIEVTWSSKSRKWWASQHRREIRPQEINPGAPRYAIQYNQANNITYRVVVQGGGEYSLLFNQLLWLVEWEEYDKTLYDWTSIKRKLSKSIKAEVYQENVPEGLLAIRYSPLPDSVPMLDNDEKGIRH